MESPRTKLVIGSLIATIVFLLFSAYTGGKTFSHMEAEAVAVVAYSIGVAVGLVGGGDTPENK